MSRRDRGTSALRRLLGRRGLERDAREEMEAHVAHRVDDLVAGGASPDEARRRALEEFGDLERLGRESVEARRAARPGGGVGDGSGGRLDGLRQDLSFAARRLRRSPGFAVTAVLTLGLGIAATTTVVGVVDAVVLEPLPFDEPDRLVFVEEVTPTGYQFSVSEPAYLDWREQARSFEDVAATAQRSATLLGRGEPRAVRTLVASASLLPVLGVEPLLGRGIAPDEDLPGEPAAVVVLGHRLWTETFGGDRGVLGTEVVLNGRAHRVVGVLPPGLSFLDDSDAMVPLGADPGTDRDEHYLDVVARLAPGVGVDDARAEMSALAERLGRIHPGDFGWSTRVTTSRDWLVGSELTRAGWLLLAGATLLLLIACVNVSNLLLARATTRRTEMAVRAALGAGRGRIVRQLLTESLVLAAGGALVGLALARAALPLVRALGGGRIPRLDQAALGPEVLAWCAAAAGAAAVLFGLAPALDLGRERSAGALRSGGRGGSPRRRGRGMLVAGQVALSVVLLVSTGLLTRSFLRLAAVDPGFDARGTLTVRLSMPGESYGPEARRALMAALLDEVRAVPGVSRAGATAVDPFSGFNLMNFVARSDRMPDDERDFLPVAWRVVTPGFTGAMDVEVLDGRGFLPTDGWPPDESAEGAPVVIGRALAETLWPEGGAVGATLVWGDPDGSRLRVVGVVEDVRDWRLEEEPMPVVYRPYDQIPWTAMTLVARTEGPPGPLVEPLRNAVRAVGPDLAIPEVRPLTRHVSEAMARPRFHALLLGVFACAGLLLAGVGIYGVTAFDVTRRFREIGIRMAVGGDPAGIRRLVLGDTLRVTLLGTAVGVAGAWGASRWVESLLYGTSPADPVTWAAAVGVVLVAAWAAAWLPAGRATRVSPADVLSTE